MFTKKELELLRHKISMLCDCHKSGKIYCKYTYLLMNECWFQSVFIIKIKIQLQ